MSKSVRIEHTPLLSKTLASDAKIIVHEGGSSSSKSYSLAQGFAYLATQERNKIYSIVRSSLPWIKKGPLVDFNRILDSTGLRSVFVENKTDTHFTCVNTGTKIEMFGIDDLEKAKGPRRDRLWVNEATELSYDIYRQLAIRTREQIWIDYNPSLIEWWIDEILKREDCLLIKSTYKDNTFLTKEMIREIEVLAPIYELSDGSAFTDWNLEIADLIHDEKSSGDTLYTGAVLVAGDPYHWSVYGLGRRGSPAEAIYPLVYDSEGLPDTERVYGLDFGYNHPTVLCELARRDVAPKQELHVHELIHEPGLTTSDLIDRMKVLKINKDQVIYADGSRPESIKEIEEAGYWIKPADKSKGSVYTGINFVKGHKLCFTPQSALGKVQHRDYRWIKKPDGTIMDEPVKKNDDCPDAARYGAYTHWGQGEPFLFGAY